jgi:hypothetical protein
MKCLLIPKSHKPRLSILLEEAEVRERARGFHAFHPLDRLIEDAAEIDLPTLYTFVDSTSHRYEICAWSEEDARKRLAKEQWMSPPFELVGQRTEWPGLSGPSYVAQEPDQDELEDKLRAEAALGERSQLLKDIYDGLIELRERGIDDCHHLFTVDMVDWIENTMPSVQNEEIEPEKESKPQNDDVPF